MPRRVSGKEFWKKVVSRESAVVRPPSVVARPSGSCGEPEVLPGVALGVGVGPHRWVRGLEGAVFVAGHKEALGRVVDVLVVACALLETSLSCTLPQGACEHADSVIWVRKLHRATRARATAFGAHIAKTQVGLHPASGTHDVRIGAAQGDLVGAPHIKIIDAANERVGEDDHRRVAHHAARFTRAQGPSREGAALLTHRDQRAIEVTLRLGREQRDQRVHRAVRVPEGEVCVVGEALGEVHFAINAAVATIHIGGQRGHQKRVIERGVEDAEIILAAALDLDLGEGLFPSGLEARLNPREVDVGGLGLKVHAGMGDVDLRERDGDGDLILQAHIEANKGAAIVGCAHRFPLGEHAPDAHPIGR